SGRCGIKLVLLSDNGSGVVSITAGAGQLWGYQTGPMQESVLALLLCGSSFTVGISEKKPSNTTVPAIPEPHQTMCAKPGPAHITPAKPGPFHVMPAMPKSLQDGSTNISSSCGPCTSDHQA
ncbi:hypothetical protein M9458_055793, partial [Cirrhinus mrigala]